MAEETFLVNRETGSSFRLGGFIPSREESDLPKFAASRQYAVSQLPPQVDLRQLMTPVENQLLTNSCVANALAGAYEFLVMKNKGVHVDVSRLFIYYNSRKKDGMQDHSMQDNGTLIRSAIAALTEFGCCKEALHPYKVQLLNQRPSAACYSEAKRYRIQQGMKVQNNLDEMKACLAEGYPFAFGIQTFASFAHAEKHGGIVPMPQPHLEPPSAQHTWHAMLCVGYFDQQRCFIVRNSWGETWGDNGYCYIPYDYMCDKQRCLDLHAIKLITDGPRLPDNKRDQIPNPYNWNVHKNTPYFVPPNYHYPYFDNTWFWKMKDLQNFFNPQWMNFQFGKGGSKGDSSNFVIEQRGRGAEGRGQVEKPEDKKFSILWIDENNEGNQHFAKKFHLSNEVSVQFFKTYADGTDYLKENQEKIRSSPSKYLLICRGYYKSEDKNPLNLLSFLDYCGLRTVPILVFTQDKSGLVTHLEAQAPSMRAFDWKERLNIVNNAEDFISKVKRLTQA